MAKKYIKTYNFHRNSPFTSKEKKGVTGKSDNLKYQSPEIRLSLSLSLIVCKI